MSPQPDRPAPSASRIASRIEASSSRVALRVRVVDTPTTIPYPLSPGPGPSTPIHSQASSAASASPLPLLSCEWSSFQPSAPVSASLSAPEYVRCGAGAKGEAKTRWIWTLRCAVSDAGEEMRERET